MIEMYTIGESIVTESQLDDLEKYFGVKFPQAYRDFMLITNGGIPLHNCFDSKDGTESSSVSFFSVLPNDTFDIVHRNKVGAGRFPHGFISIGADGNGNAICIDCNSGPAHGKIYFWEHENEADQAQGETPETVQNIYLLGDTFTEFLDGLHDIELPDFSNSYVVDDPIAKARFKALVKPEDYWFDD
jgi:hypothetical protein